MKPLSQNKPVTELFTNNKPGSGVVRHSRKSKSFFRRILVRHQKHHALLRYIIEHSHGGVAVHDRELRYIYVNHKYLEDYRVTDKEIIGKHHYDVFPDLPEKWREVYKKVLNGEVHRSDCDPFISPDGQPEYARWEWPPVV